MNALDGLLGEARARYQAANPKSQAAHREASQYMPGGNTRSVLHFEPFPLTIASGQGASLVDLDGHQYIDFVGEFSAGIHGHSDPAIGAAIRQAVDQGIGLGAPGTGEGQLAKILCQRFDSIERVRFCNSGTEANLMALAAARVITGRSRILVFNGAYHGGVIKFPEGHSDLNVPYDFVYADYNDTSGTARLIREAGADLAAVIVEPVLGAGGNIPGSPGFLKMLREATRDSGSLLVFDEVKTARLGPAGMQGLLGIRPDLTTLGKIIGGGLPIGAFGGPAGIMDHFNPRKPGSWKHAGTFNNNVCSMAAGCAALGAVYTASRARRFFEWSESVRCGLNELFRARGVPMVCNGTGSMFAIHFSETPLSRMVIRDAARHTLHRLLHMELLLGGILICTRGDLFLSLPLTDDHIDKLRGGLEQFIDRHRDALEQFRGAEAALPSGRSPEDPVRVHPGEAAGPAD